ncbi:ATP-binding protein [Streptomyces sp. NBC_00237]|uniref:ATP-binding protein n=1 Tax=Streptomyces sp. NBC_00237 TaxID=2975687 RepID=UPI0022528B02|nr:ATP-binding protein [Streptomyces sp. NBC_00237]MCX5204977.1 ATP-binding protein [Streptomyces sp. NBC_00237]
MNKEIPTLSVEFEQRISSTRRGARLARLLAERQIQEWGVPYGCEFADAVATVVAELAANAVLHGRVEGEDFSLRLALGDVLRIEVGDARGKCRPARQREMPGIAEGGLGLVLVEELTERWGVTEDGPGKTVWAELRWPGAG